jgi:DNA-directed RNA polymerase subunit RPC12/RpoP
METGYIACIRCGGRQVYQTQEVTSAYAVTFDAPGPIDPTFVNKIQSTVYRCRECGERATWRETEYGRTKRLEKRQKVLSIIGNLSLAVLGALALNDAYLYLYADGGAVIPFFGSFVPLILLLGIYGVTAPLLNLMKSILRRREGVENLYYAVYWVKMYLNTLSLFALVFLLQVTFLSPAPLELAISLIGSGLVPIGYLGLVRYRVKGEQRRERERQKRLEAESEAVSAPSLGQVEELELIEAPRQVTFLQALSEAPLTIFGIVPGVGMLLYSISMNIIDFVSLQGIWHSVMYWLVTTVALICLSFGLFTIPRIMVLIDAVEEMLNGKRDSTEIR